MEPFFMLYREILRNVSMHRKRKRERERKKRTGKEPQAGTQTHVAQSASGPIPTVSSVLIHSLPAEVLSVLQVW